MKTVLIERAWFKKIQDDLCRAGPKYFIDVPGDYFSPEKSDEWIEPRILGFDRSENRGDTETLERMEIQIRCFVKSQPKGKLFLGLSTLVDSVREVLDETEGAVMIDVTDEDGKTVIGNIQPGHLDEDREYGISADILGEIVDGLDIAVLTGTAIVTGGC